MKITKQEQRKVKVKVIMRGAYREHDEDDKAGAEESDPGYAQDSHALEKDFSWYY